MAKQKIEILNLIDRNGWFAKRATATVFAQADKLKMGRAHFERTARTSHATGKVDALETLLRSHKANPYMSVDDLIGDIQVLIIDSWNEVRRLDPENHHRLKLEDIIKGDESGIPSLSGM